MNTGARYTIGTDVVCRDGACGRLDRVVVDPIARALTHLVVDPADGPRISRLVPIELVQEAADEIQLRCTGAEFQALDDAQETHFLSMSGEQLGYGDEEAFAWPYYGLASGIGGIGVGGIGLSGGPPLVTYDRVPVGEVDLRRGEHVHALDGSIGQVQGLVIDPADHHVTHVLLQDGHLWGKHAVAIPISAVKAVEPEGVQLNISREQVRDLPAVDFDR